MKMSLCSRYARYSSWGGWGRAPDSNVTGVSRSADTALETAARSSASSSRVELTNTRRRWSGVRIAVLCSVGPVMDEPPERESAYAALRPRPPAGGNASRPFQVRGLTLYAKPTPLGMREASGPERELLRSSQEG